MINLNQEIPKINITLKPNFKPKEEILKHADIIKINKSQYGNYSYRTEVSNRILKEYVFDKFEREIFSILKYSKEAVRNNFFAGLIEAEGSIDSEKGDISIAFGTSNPFDNEKVLNTFKKALLYREVLKFSNIDYYISRKYSYTEKTHTLKYDIRIKRHSLKTFNNKIGRFITHPKKIIRLEELKTKLTKKKETESLVPELNIGLVGQ